MRRGPLEHQVLEQVCHAGAADLFARHRDDARAEAGRESQPVCVGRKQRAEVVGRSARPARRGDDAAEQAEAHRTRRRGASGEELARQALSVPLFISAALIVGVSLARDAWTTATMGILLASYSTVLQPLGWLSAASNLVLAATGVALMLRPKWAAPGIAAMAGSYGAFFFWQILGAFGDGGAVGTDDPLLASHVREQRMYGFRGDRHAHVQQE